MQKGKKRMTKSRKTAAPRQPAASTVTGNAVALSISAMMLASTAAAQDAPDEAQVELDTVRIQDRTIDTNPYAEPGVPYKARISGDPRRLKDIADTPTTMSVLTQTQIEDSGKSDLREILSAQPGITLGTGEGGNAFGDRYIIRGHEARSDVFVDRLRDPGMTIRESFALEQVEITKGPSSTFAGRGSTGGAINGITKQANSEYDFVKFQGGPGTDECYRVHLDVNKRISDDLAVRGNLLYADEEVPDRAPAERLRRGAYLDADVGFTRHGVVLGVEYAEPHVLNGRYDVDNRGDPNCSFRLRGQLRDGSCISDEHGAVVGGLDALMGRHVTRGAFDSDSGVDTTSVSLMDTVDLPWGFSTFLGVRADSFDYANTVVGRSGVTTDYTYSALLWNGHAGLVSAFADRGKPPSTSSTKPSPPKSSPPKASAQSWTPRSNS